MAQPLIDLDDEGTPAHLWTAWGTEHRALEIESCQRLVVWMWGDDDEILGAGGLIALARGNDIPVTVVIVTDGEGAYPGSPSYTPRALASLRIEESRRAARVVGAQAPTRLAFPDGAVGSREEELTSALRGVLFRETGPDVWCATTWRNDGHPDHEAVGRATAAACKSSGATLLEFPVWMFQWAHPDDAVVPSDRARALALPAKIVRTKLAAIDEYSSQAIAASTHPADRPILPPHVLERLAGRSETFFV